MSRPHKRTGPAVGGEAGSKTPEAAEVRTSVPRHSDSWPGHFTASRAAKIDMIDVGLATALVLLLPLAWWSA